MKMLYLASLALLCLAAAVDAVALGEACDASKTCDGDLVCDNAKCKKKLDAVCVNKDECVTNADCKDDSGTKTCKCNANFAANADKTKCLAPVGEACDGNKLCKADLVCDNAKCKKKLDATCGNKDECVTNADCKDDSGTNKCKCNANFAANTDKTKCYVPAALGEACNANKVCAANLVCDKEKCRNKLEAVCTKDDECVTNAACKDESGTKKCKCNDNYTANTDKTKCSGASAVLASVVLMLAALGASRWM